MHLPAKSVDDSSDVSSWGEENFSTTGDESSSTKGCDFGVIPLPSAGECFNAIGCKSSSKESSIADLTSSHFNCQGDLTNPELKGLLNLILCVTHNDLVTNYFYRIVSTKVSQRSRAAFTRETVQA